MMPPILEQPLQPKIFKFLDGLRRKNKKSGARLIETCVGKPDETLLEIENEALLGDIEGVADEIATMLQRRADDRRTRIRSQLMADGEEPLYLPCRPSVPASALAPKYNGRMDSMDDAGEAAQVLNPEDGLPDDGYAGMAGAPKLSHQAAQFALDALGHNRAMFRLTMASAIRREHDDRRRILQLEGQVSRYQEVIDKAVLVREQLLDRQAERTLEIDRVKQRDQWMQDGFAKIFGLVALHAPSILPKFGIDIDPRAREVLFDIVGSVAAAKPYVSAMRLAASVGENAPPPPPKKVDTATTAGAVAATTVVGGGTAVAASTLAAYASIAVRFISGVKDKLTMVRGMLPTDQVELMDQLLQLTETHGAMFQAVGQAVLQGGSQVTAPAAGAAPPPPGGASSEEKRLAKFIDLCSDFWTFARPEDDDKMRAFLPAQAKAALDEVRRDYTFAKPKTN